MLGLIGTAIGIYVLYMAYLWFVGDEDKPPEEQEPVDDSISNAIKLKRKELEELKVLKENTEMEVEIETQKNQLLAELEILEDQLKAESGESKYTESTGKKMY